jgi:hypothetical protein
MNLYPILLIILIILLILSAILLANNSFIFSMNGGKFDNKNIVRHSEGHKKGGMIEMGLLSHIFNSHLSEDFTLEEKKMGLAVTNAASNNHNELLIIGIDPLEFQRLIYTPITERTNSLPKVYTAIIAEYILNAYFISRHGDDYINSTKYTNILSSKIIDRDIAHMRASGPTDTHATSLLGAMSRRSSVSSSGSHIDELRYIIDDEDKAKILEIVLANMLSSNAPAPKPKRYSMHHSNIFGIGKSSIYPPEYSRSKRSEEVKEEEEEEEEEERAAAESATEKRAAAAEEEANIICLKLQISSRVILLSIIQLCITNLLYTRNHIGYLRSIISNKNIDTFLQIFSEIFVKNITKILSKYQMHLMEKMARLINKGLHDLLSEDYGAKFDDKYNTLIIDLIESIPIDNLFREIESIYPEIEVSRFISEKYDEYMELSKLLDNCAHVLLRDALEMLMTHRGNTEESNAAISSSSASALNYGEGDDVLGYISSMNRAPALSSSTHGERDVVEGRIRRKATISIPMHTYFQKLFIYRINRQNPISFYDHSDEFLRLFESESITNNTDPNTIIRYCLSKALIITEGNNVLGIAIIAYNLSKIMFSRDYEQEKKYIKAAPRYDPDVIRQPMRSRREEYAKFREEDSQEERYRKFMAAKHKDIEERTEALRRRPEASRDERSLYPQEISPEEASNLIF